MDEPFAALDAITRDFPLAELQRIWRATDTAVVFVTHDVREAVRLGQRVVLLSSRPGIVAREWLLGPDTDRVALTEEVTDRLREVISTHARAWLVGGIDQIPPILPRVGHVMGAGRVDSARLILLPAALPGYLTGCKQGWAFSWRSLMAAEIIAVSPQLGMGLGAYLKEGSDLNSMPGVIAAIFLILLIGIGVELLAFRPVERRVLHSRGLMIAT